MWTTAKIRRHINNLTTDHLFTTREFLLYGSRAAVDQALSRLVKSGLIQRLARGVFVKANPAGPVVSAFEVAKAKAQAFGKQIMQHATDALHAFGLSSSGNQQPTYATSGHSSAFRFGDTEIRLRGTGPRKMKLGDSCAGSFIRALWHLGQSGCSKDAVQSASLALRRSDRQELKQHCPFMPAWLRDRLYVRG